jgi:hypothetical protein
LRPAVVPCFLVQGMLCASPPRFELRLWLPEGCTERARRGRACASTAVATHHGTIWTRSRDSLVCLRTPAAARSTWTFHVLVLTVAVHFPCELVGMLCLGAGIVDAAATPRAAPLVTRALLRVGVRGKSARQRAGKPRTPAWSHGWAGGQPHPAQPRRCAGRPCLARWSRPRRIVLGAVGDPRVEGLPPREPQPPPVRTWERCCTARPQGVPGRFVEHLVCVRTWGDESN